MRGGEAFQHGYFNDTRKAAKRVWIWVCILTALICLYPVEYQITRIAFVVGWAATWTGALLLWWKRKPIRISLLLAGVLPAVAVCLPGRAVDPDVLAADYARGLRCFRGVRYVWGGESLLGIDCSGLVRKGLVWGQLCHGLRTVNGKPIRDAMGLWWHDSSALALRDGYRGWTTELFRETSVAGADHSKLKTGDLAVTADGIHVMAYLGSSTWIEADPDAHRVIEVVTPTDNQWFKTPVVFVRWKWLRSPKSPNPAPHRTAAPHFSIEAPSLSNAGFAACARFRRRSVIVRSPDAIDKITVDEIYFVMQSKAALKTLLRTTAGLSFLFPFVCGVWLLHAGLSSKTVEDSWFPIVIGSFLLGNAFFIGAILLFAAEKLGRNHGSR